MGISDAHVQGSDFHGSLRTSISRKRREEGRGDQRMTLGWQWLGRLGDGKRGRGSLLCPRSLPQLVSTKKVAFLLHLHTRRPHGQQTSPPGTGLHVATVSSFCVRNQSHHQKKQRKGPEARGNRRNLKEDTWAGPSSLEGKCPQVTARLGGCPQPLFPVFLE